MTYRASPGFSLIELIVALGLFAFCIVGLLNLLTVGIQATGQTERRLDAANIAQMLVEVRRLYPTNPSSINLSKWGLPPISSSAITASSSNAIVLSGSANIPISEEGKIVAENSSEAAYRLDYRYTLPNLMQSGSNSNVSCVNVYVRVRQFHPGDNNPASSKPASSYEFTTSITLP